MIQPIESSDKTIQEQFSQSKNTGRRVFMSNHSAVTETYVANFSTGEVALPASANGVGALTGVTLTGHWTSSRVGTNRLFQTFRWARTVLCSMQPDMRYFDVPGVGYMSFMKVLPESPSCWEIRCALENLPLMIDRFLTRFPNAVFCQVTRPVMNHLSQSHQYYGTQMGSQSVLDLTKVGSGREKASDPDCHQSGQKEGCCGT